MPLGGVVLHTLPVYYKKHCSDGKHARTHWLEWQV